MDYEASISVPSKIESIDLLHAFVESFMTLKKYDPDDIYHATFATREMAANSMENAHNWETEIPLQLYLRDEEDGVRIYLRDRGNEYFDPAARGNKVSSEISKKDGHEIVEMIGKRRAKKRGTKQPSTGLGCFLASQFAELDSRRWSYQGQEGNETEIFIRKGVAAPA